MLNLFTKKIFYIPAVFIALLAVMYFYSRNFSGSFIFPAATSTISAEAQSQPAPHDLPTTEPSAYLPNGLMEYKNSYYKFKLSYPSDLSVSEFAENNGGRTILFQSSKADEQKGFQIFITPYKYKEVTQERFKMDEPSGVINQQTEIIIDGIHAVMFYSKSGIIGDTREVWFINNGFLYEVATYKDLDSWLSEIMATWKFI